MAADILLIPVHNRRETTLRCLRQLRADGVLGWATALVIDDGSSDGTGEAVRAEFAEVEVLTGTGDWWWGGAIRRGTEWALARAAERIYWLNDDCLPPAGALAALRDLVRTQEAVAWVPAVTPCGWRYGGHRRTTWGIRQCTPEEEAQGRAETFSGNCVCLPRSRIERVGLPDDRSFPHGLADLDYGLRLHRAGAPLCCLPGYVAAAADPGPAARERWLTTTRSMHEIRREFSSPRSFLHFPAWRRFALRHWGPLLGGVVFALPYLRWATIAVLRTVAPALCRRLGRRPLR